MANTDTPSSRTRGPSEYGRLRRTHGYVNFFAAATSARIADEMFSVAVVLHVLDRTGSAIVAGATVAFVTFPSLLTAPLLGGWLDLTGRRRFAMICDQLLAATGLTLLLFLPGTLPVVNGDHLLCYEIEPGPAPRPPLASRLKTSSTAMVGRARRTA